MSSFEKSSFLGTPENKFFVKVFWPKKGWGVRGMATVYWLKSTHTRKAQIWVP